MIREELFGSIGPSPRSGESEAFKYHVIDTLRKPEGSQTSLFVCRFRNRGFVLVCEFQLLDSQLLHCC